MTSSPHVKQKTFIEANCSNNMHSGEKVFRAVTFEDL